MNTSNVISQIFDALLGGLTEVVSAIPTAIKDTFQALFFTTTEVGGVATTNVSSFAIVMLIFGGVALAIGITKLVFHLVGRKVGA